MDSENRLKVVNTESAKINTHLPRSKLSLHQETHIAIYAGI